MYIYAHRKDVPNINMLNKRDYSKKELMDVAMKRNSMRTPKPSNATTMKPKTTIMEKKKKKTRP